jgi:hypothetical protein
LHTQPIKSSTLAHPALRSRPKAAGVRNHVVKRGQRQRLARQGARGHSLGRGAVGVGVGVGVDFGGWGHAGLTAGEQAGGAKRCRPRWQARLSAHCPRAAGGVAFEPPRSAQGIPSLRAQMRPVQVLGQNFKVCRANAHVLKQRLPLRHLLRCVGGHAACAGGAQTKRAGF